MTIDQAVFIFAGAVVLNGVALGAFVHPAWLALPAFAGANMIQAQFTGFCPAAVAFRALGFARGSAF